MSDKKNQNRIRVSVQETKKRVDEGDVTILDVIDTHSYDQYSYQIENAVRINPEDIEDDFTRLPKDKAVYAY
jgi:rhodanese-related sulfurtransferase